MIRAADLFAGAGGASTGLEWACRERARPLDLVAVNHWDVAISTHERNHPDQRHFCAPVQDLDPREAVPGGELDVLIAAPECTHFSMARGGRPMDDQKRASAWHILRWLELLHVRTVLIENVPEFQTWGPIGSNGRPMQSRKGETFLAFVNAIQSLGYTVEWRVLNSADYGEAQTRKRLFIQARRGRRPVWPEPTHTSDPQAELFGEQLERWRPARDVIDWSLEGESIFTRKRPLADKTLARIRAGVERYWGEAFLVPFLGEREGQAPRTRPIDEPLQTVTSSNPIGLCEPFLVTLRNNADARGLDDPLPAVTASGTHHALVEPFVLSQASGGAPRPVSSPAPTIPASGGGTALVEPFLVKFYGTADAASIDKPCPTITTRDRLALVEGNLYEFDIRFRMLQPHELSAAMGFPAEYEFNGNKRDQVKQIGNAISVRTMKALCEASVPRLAAAA